MMYRDTRRVEYPSRPVAYIFKMVFKSGKTWDWSFMKPDPYEFVIRVIFPAMRHTPIKEGTLYHGKVKLDTYTPEEGWKKEGDRRAF